MHTQCPVWITMVHCVSVISIILLNSRRMREDRKKTTKQQHRKSERKCSHSHCGTRAGEQTVSAFVRFVSRHIVWISYGVHWSTYHIACGTDDRDKESSFHCRCVRRERPRDALATWPKHRRTYRLCVRFHAKGLNGKSEISTIKLYTCSFTFSLFFCRVADADLPFPALLVHDDMRVVLSVNLVKVTIVDGRWFQRWNLQENLKMNDVMKIFIDGSAIEPFHYSFAIQMHHFYTSFFSLSLKFNISKIYPYFTVEVFSPVYSVDNVR